jgi:beta-glucosidase
MAYRGVWLAFLGVVTAQTTTGSSANTTISASAAFNGSTAPSPTAPVLQLNLNLEDVWDLLIGPVEVAETTTVYEPSPVPSSSLIPPPPIYYSPFPTGQQVPLVPKNESWSFPEHFWCVCDALVGLQSLTDILQVGSRRRSFPNRRRREGRRSWS